METKEVNDFRNTKPHQNKEKLAEMWNSNMNASEISKALNISVKLVHIKLKEYGLF